ncbi:hypothetical protein [Marinobacter litoralis]|uniref:hypothetical protein n=1 Tax=Marinobacter litoralis TaxID=187981 RepID=UPI0018EC0E62|nr:hypothetical protein [Marinobacter litoralis]MBJ6137340.1 hypothetical protein [Marinobacter litoralis]
MIISYRSVRALLFLAMLFIPFTSLRFGILGFGEIFILISLVCFLYVGRGRLNLDVRLQPFLWFWVSFLVLSILGLLVNAFFFGLQSGRPGTGLFDFASYFFILMSVVLLADRKLFPQGVSEKFFRDLFFLWGVLFSVLYFLSLFYSSILGFSLRYHHFYSPLVNNVHQAASITCSMAFVMLSVVRFYSSLFMRVLAFLMGLLFARMALESGSTKALMGVVVGGCVAVFFLIFYRSKGVGKLYFNLMALGGVAIFGMAFVSMYHSEILSFGVQFFTENDGSSARESLYLNGFNHGLRSFLVGFGPGSHTPYSGGFSDAHNSILTVFLQGGFLGVLVLVYFFSRLLFLVRGNFFLIGALAAILMYVIGGDILRRLPIWVILVGIGYLSQSLQDPNGSRIRSGG